MRPGHRPVARVRLTDATGNLVCARLHPPAITWSAEPGQTRACAGRGVHGHIHLG